MFTVENIKDSFKNVDVKQPYSDSALETIAMELNTGAYDYVRFNNTTYDLVVTILSVFTEYNSYEACCEAECITLEDIEDINGFKLADNHILWLG